MTTPKPKSPPWTASERVHRWTLSLESTGVRQDVEGCSRLFPSVSVDKLREMLENTNLNEIPRQVEFNGMVVNNLGRWLGTGSKEFREIVHSDQS